MKRYYVDRPDNTYVQIRLFMKYEADKFQKLVFVNYKPDEFLSLLDVINSESERALLNQSLCSIV